MAKTKEHNESIGVTRRNLIKSATAAAVIVASGRLPAQIGKPVKKAACDATTADTKSFHALALWLAITTNPDFTSCGQDYVEQALGLPKGSMTKAWSRISDTTSFPSGTQLSSPSDMYGIVRQDFQNFIANVVYPPTQCPKSLQPIVKVSQLYA
jgi:hypothetical protein